MDTKTRLSLNAAILNIAEGKNHLDEADNTAAIAKQVKQAVKKYTTGKLVVRSKGGKTRFIAVIAHGNIDNKLRVMMADVMYPKANIKNRDDISYGNISDKIISASADVWVKALGLKESVELDEASQRFGGDTNIPASPQTKKHIESGKGIILDVPSSLHPTARFAIYKNPAKGSKQDKVLMATISNPKRGRVKMFSFHGTHVSHQKAMDFAKHHKLVAREDEKGNPLYAKESVELDEGKQLELLKKYGTTIMKMWDKEGASSDEIAKKLKLNSKDTKTLKGLMDESVELDERFGGDTNIPADKKTKAHIESGKALIHNNVLSTLHKSARFVVIRNPNKGSNQDGYLMATISDPMKGRIKMFSYHGSHPSISGAMKFAKQHKLVPPNTMESVELGESSHLKKGDKVKWKGKTGTVVRYDKNGPQSPFYVVSFNGQYKSENIPAHKLEESVLYEGKMKELHMHIQDGKTAQQIAKIMKIDLKTVKALMKDMNEAKSDYTITATKNKKIVETMPVSKREIKDVVKFLKQSHKGATITVKDAKGKVISTESNSPQFQGKYLQSDNKLNSILKTIIDID